MADKLISKAINVTEKIENSLLSTPVTVAAIFSSEVSIGKTILGIGTKAATQKTEEPAERSGKT